MVGAFLLLVFVVAGFQYISSAGEPANVKRAKSLLMNGVIGLVLYMMMFAILSFFIPGGVFS